MYNWETCYGWLPSYFANFQLYAQNILKSIGGKLQFVCRLSSWNENSRRFHQTRTFLQFSLTADEKPLRISFPIMSCRARLYKKIPSIPQVRRWWSQSAQKGSLFWSGSNKRRQTMYGNQSIMLSIVNWPTFQSFWLHRQQLLRVTSRVFFACTPIRRISYLNYFQMKLG